MDDQYKLPFLDSALEILDKENAIISDIKPSEWAENKRFMNSSVSAFEGPFSYDRTPYLKEIVNRIHFSDPNTRIAVMKGAQLGFSTGVLENGLGFIISEQPGPVLWMTATSELSRFASETKVDQMIQSTGLTDHIRPNVVKRKNQRTGDTVRSKEFTGGYVKFGSISNHKEIRQFSARYIFADDLEASIQSSKQSGDTIKLFEQRAATYGDKRKIFLISTPEVKETSNIYPAYLMGDQRRYFVPCPCCGEYIILEWETTIRNSKDMAGITWKLDNNNKLIEESVGYICQECGDFFRDGHKHEMNLSGEWKPTTESSEPNYLSYHLSALYAPIGMFDWEHYVRDYLRCNPPNGDKDIGKEKTFYNMCLGLPYDERGKDLNAKILNRNTREYKVGQIPILQSRADGNGDIVLITCACDLNGVMADGKNYFEDDVRLDYEIVAWSESGSSYSVDHGSIGTFIPRENTLKNKTDREKWSYDFFHPNSVWKELIDLVTKPYYTDDGGEMKVMITGIDCGYHTSYAYDFIDKSSGYGIWTIGITGRTEETLNKFKSIGINTKLFVPSSKRDDLFHFDVDQLKDELAIKVGLRWNARDGVQQPHGFMNFPEPANGKYTQKNFFSHFEAEEKTYRKNSDGHITGFVWKKKGASVMNHYLDTRVYNDGLRLWFADLFCREMGIKNPSWRAYVEKVKN